MKRRKPRKISRAKRVYKKRVDPGYEEWRKAVLKRDGKKCQMPGCSHKKRLQVHHIIRYADNSRLKTNVHNGITLCVKHHNLIKDKEHNYVVLFTNIVRQNNAK